MKNILSLYKTSNKTFVDWLNMLALALIGYVFIAHGLEALFQTAQLLPLAAYVGMSEQMGTWFIWLVGIIDVVVGLLVLFRPFKLLFIYAFLWMGVPLYVQFMALGELEIVSKILVWVSALFICYYHCVLKRV